MGDEGAYVQFARKDESGDFFLQGKIGGVAADEVFFVHADGGEVNAGADAAPGMGKQHDLAAAANELQGAGEGIVRWNGQDGGVDGNPGRRATECPPYLARRTGPFCAPLAGEFEARFEEVRGEDFHAAQGQKARKHQADRALAGDEHGIAAQEGKPVDGLEDGIDGFLHGAFDEGVSGRDFDDAGQDEGHDAHVFRITAAGRLETRSDAGAFVLGALGKGAMAAGVASQTRNMMMQGDAVADAESPYARAEADDGPGGFMTENARGRDGAVVDFLDIGGANTAGGDFDEEVACSDARDGKGFEAEIIYAVINNGLHGPRNGKHG